MAGPVRRYRGAQSVRGDSVGPGPSAHAYRWDAARWVVRTAGDELSGRHVGKLW